MFKISITAWLSEMMSINDLQKVILKTWHLGKLVLIDSIPGREKEATSENVCHWKLLETFQLYCSVRLSPMLLPSPTLTESYRHGDGQNLSWNDFKWACSREVSFCVNYLNRYSLELGIFLISWPLIKVTLRSPSMDSKFLLWSFNWKNPKSYFREEYADTIFLKSKI